MSVLDKFLNQFTRDAVKASASSISKGNEHSSSDSSTSAPNIVTKSAIRSVSNSNILANVAGGGIGSHVIGAGEDILKASGMALKSAGLDATASRILVGAEIIGGPVATGVALAVNSVTPASGRLEKLFENPLDYAPTAAMLKGDLRLSELAAAHLALGPIAATREGLNDVNDSIAELTKAGQPVPEALTAQRAQVFKGLQHELSSLPPEVGLKLVDTMDAIRSGVTDSADRCTFEQVAPYQQQPMAGILEDRANAKAIDDCRRTVEAHELGPSAVTGPDSLIKRGVEAARSDDASVKDFAPPDASIGLSQGLRGRANRKGSLGGLKTEHSEASVTPPAQPVAPPAAQQLPADVVSFSGQTVSPGAIGVSFRGFTGLGM